MKTWKSCAWLLGVTLMVAAGTAQAGTLEQVKARGKLICGTSGSTPGFSAPDNNGKMQGLDADMCYAVAAAIFGDKGKVDFVPLTLVERFTALAAGEVDVLSRSSTNTLTRDASLGIDFTYNTFIDGQGFLVRKSLNAKGVADLDGATICMPSGTDTEPNLAAYFTKNKLTYKPVGFDTEPQVREAFDAGACDVISSDKAILAAMRTELSKPDEVTILPDTISKEPNGPWVRQGDSEWADVVRWSIYGMIAADELGVSSKNVDEMKTQSGNSPVLRLLGVEGETGKLLKVQDDWGYQIVKQVGNYDESYQRNVTPLGLPREGTPNALWNKGGVLLAPPL
ncbi:amino acid ABC transporter substrate-binding protein [Mesorhizobium koreense]|uniref:amino acid ABC transporter substrate-binding protein n=1 Tax=Mesorhizobium koreense TaxID=3074855 RepID=UPI00287B5F2F|nr:amino acid ABC transporter substrate-binding protein [Mesorhizobium sp. WR6]